MNSHLLSESGRGITQPKDKHYEGAVVIKLIITSQDLSDLDLDKAADDVDLFDNEAALSEAVTQAFEVLSRSPNLDSTPAAATASAAATMNPSSLFIGEPDLQQILVPPQPKKSRGGKGGGGGGGVKGRRKKKNIKNLAAKNLGGKAQTPRRPRKHQQQQQEQPLVHVKAAPQPPTKMRRLNKRQTAALVKTKEKWLPLPTSTSTSTSGQARAAGASSSSSSSAPRMRAKRCMGISGGFWQCDLCEFWHYHKHGMAKHLEATH